MLRWTVLIGLLCVTQPLFAQTPEEVQRDYDRAVGRVQGGSRHALVTIRARHEDGTPLRGFIQCSGYWQKYQDRQNDEEIEFVKHLPFKTDSRGAIAMNPLLADEWIFCWASDKGKTGSVIAQFDEDNPRRVVDIVLK